MIKEYINYVKDNFKLVEMNKKYLILMLLTALIYRVFLVLVTFFAALIIKYATNNNAEMIYISLALLASSYLIYKLFEFINCKLYGKNMCYIYKKVMKKVLKKLVKIDDDFTQSVSKGKLINSVNSDVIRIGESCDNLTETIAIILQLSIILVVISFYNIYFGILFLIYIIIYIDLKNYFDRKSCTYLKKEQNNVDEYSSLFSQVLVGRQEIKSFNMLPKLEKKLNKIKKDYDTSYMIKRKYIRFKDITTGHIITIFRIILYIILLNMIMNNMIGVEVLVLIIGYLESVTIYLDGIILRSSAIRTNDVSIKRIDSILNYQNKSQVSYGYQNKDDIKGIVEFKNVTFKYQKNYILKNFNLIIKQNKITAIVGQSGTGKTTIINLLLRLYKVNTGTILIDDINIYDYTKETYKTNVGVVNQKPFIFNMSIRKNLDFVDKNIDRQIEACKRVGIHDFIMSLPKGYNTILRENATNISGGQKQLIALARTLLSKAEILLLDEITSSLDSNTSIKVENLLNELKKDHTIILITHKPELMKKADRIIVLHQGKIVGDGIHSVLIENNEHYKWLQARKSASKFGGV